MNVKFTQIAKGRKMGRQRPRISGFLNTPRKEILLLRGIISVFTRQLQLFKITYLICFSFAVLYMTRVLSKPDVELCDYISLH